MSTILVAVDGSSDADRAFEEAAALAKELQSGLYIMTVVLPEPAVTAEGMVTEVPTPRNQQLDAMLTNYVAKAHERYNILAEYGTWSGDTSKAIINAALEKNARMIVLGSRGLSKAKEIFLGSVSHAVVRESKIPVLIVK